MRLGLLISTLLIALAAVSSASADKPARTIVPAPDDLPITGQCAFPVLAHIEGYEVHTTFNNRGRDEVRLFGTFPGNMLTLTNLDTGKAITRPATGSFSEDIAADGSEVIKVTGHGPWFPHPFTGEPGIWYQSGLVSAGFDADGNMLWGKSAGTLANLCSELAA